MRSHLHGLWCQGADHERHAARRSPGGLRQAHRPAARTKISNRNVNVFYGDKQALFDVSIDIPSAVTAFIGPSGCGKSTFLRCMNRMNDTILSAWVTGTIEIDGQNIYDRDLDVVQLRARVGMVFQKANPFAKSIYENVAYGLASTAWPAAGPISTRSSRNRSARRGCGTR